MPAIMIQVKKGQMQPANSTGWHSENVAKENAAAFKRYKNKQHWVDNFQNPAFGPLTADAWVYIWLDEPETNEFGPVSP